jgi:uncharacterized membrane protein
MSLPVFLLLTFLIGVVAGLRAFTAPMVVSWSARIGWIDLHHTWAAFLGTLTAAIILTVLAVAELVNDQSPTAPSRKAPPSFAFRIFSGGFSAAALAAGVGGSLLPAIISGVIGAIAGTLGGYDARTELVRALKVPDRAIALPEDAIAVGGGFLAVALLSH